MDSFSHDRHVAFVSHLSHITSFALANTVLTAEKSEETIFNLASGGLESTVRLGKSSPEMWAPIFLNNREPILEALNLHIEKLKVFKSEIETGKTSELKQEMKSANEIRRILDNIAKTRLKSAIPNQNDVEFQESLARYRYYIDDIDSELLRLLALRWKLVEKIGQLKSKFKVDFLQKDRFKQVVSNGLKTGLPLGLRSGFIQKLFELIHHESIELQKTTKPNKTEKE
jgi:chorismate mutase